MKNCSADKSLQKMGYNRIVSGYGFQVNFALQITLLSNNA